MPLDGGKNLWLNFINFRARKVGYFIGERKTECLAGGYFCIIIKDMWIS